MCVCAFPGINLGKRGRGNGESHNCLTFAHQVGINVNDSEDYVVYATETLAPALSGLTFFAGVPLETKLPRQNSNTHVTALGHPATAS